MTLTVDDLIKEYGYSRSEYWFTHINELNDNYKKYTGYTKTIDKKYKVSELQEQLKVLEIHKILLTKYTSEILTNPNPTFKYGVDKTQQALSKDIAILKKLIEIAKKSSRDTKVNLPKSVPTATKKSTTPIQTTSTTDKPTAAIPNISLPLTPDTWGIKFTIAGATTEPKLGKQDPFSPLFGPNAEVSVPQNTYFMDLLPARQSTIPVQGGRDVPNAMPGLNYKLVTQVGKQAIPGFSPVYQNLGIKGMQVTIVGAFTGGDGANQLVDAPDPKDNFKTNNPFWSNAKGSPTLSDNPGRGDKLPELNAYNSYTEFVQVCQQGKHMEVEINLFQVYNQNIATQIGEAVRLQSKNGNPKFTGIVRSLDVYHATKERTWYTLIMDVTDFGMASKKSINLNAQLKAAIDKAQAELDKVKAAEVQKSLTKEGNLAIDNTAGNDDKTKAGLTAAESIIDRVNDLKSVNSVLYQEQVNGFEHMIAYLKYVQDSDFYPTKDYFSKQPKTGYLSYVGDLIKTFMPLGGYENISFRSIESENVLFVRVDIRCLTTLLNVRVTCAEQIYWKLDFNKNTRKPITRYNNNPDKEYSIQPFDYLVEGTKEELESYKSKIQQPLSANKMKQVGMNGLGCVLGTATGAIAAGAATTVVTGGTGIITAPFWVGVAIAGASNCGLQFLAEAVNSTWEFNINDNEYEDQFWSQFIINSLFGLGTGIKLAPKGSRINLPKKQGRTVKGRSGSSNPLDEFNLLKNRKSPIPPNQPNLLTRLLNLEDEQVLVGQRIIVKSKTGNGTDIIDVDKVIKINNGNKANFVIRSNTGKTYTVSDIVQVPPKVFTQPKLTPVKPSDPTTAPSSTKPSQPTTTSSGTAGNTVSQLDGEIKKLQYYSNDFKNYLLSLTPFEKETAIKFIKSAEHFNPYIHTLEVRLNNNKTIIIKGKTTISNNGQITLAGSTETFNIKDINFATLKPLKQKPTTTSQLTPPPVASVNVAITKLPNKYADDAAKTAISGLPEVQQKKIISLINDIEATGLDNIEFSIKNSKIQAKINSIKVTANGDIQITTDKGSIPVNPLDLNYKKLLPQPPTGVSKPPSGVPKTQSTSPSSTPEVSQPNPVPPSVSVPPGLREYNTEIFSFLNQYSGKQGIPDIIIKTNGVYYKINNFNIVGDSIQIKGVMFDKVAGKPMDKNIVTINSQIKNITELRNSKGDYLVLPYSVQSLNSLDNFLLNLKSDEITYIGNNALGSNSPNLWKTYSDVKIHNIKKADKNVYLFMDRDAVSYQKMYTFSDNTSISVETLNSEFTINKTKINNVKNSANVPDQQATTVKPNSFGTSYRLVTNKSEIKTYISNLSEGDIIFYDRDDNLGLQMLNSFTGNNPKEAGIKILSTNFNGKYAIAITGDTGRPNPATSILSLDELVKFINGISIPN